MCEGDTRSFTRFDPAAWGPAPDRCFPRILTNRLCLCLAGRKAAECASAISVILINRAAGDDGTEDARLGELRWRHFGEIVRKDDEVGVLTLFQFALLPFLELRVSRA